MMPERTERDVVLVVDDSPETLSFLTNALRDAGVTVLVALDGDGALAAAKRITPDVILLDAVMPGIDGFETCRQLKRMRHVANVPVIFMTGLDDTDHVVKGFEVGGVDYLTKPIIVDELMVRMRAHLANGRMAQSLHLALDTAGRFLLAVTGRGRILWYTPQAGRLLGDVLLRPAITGSDVGGTALPSGIIPWIGNLERAGQLLAATSSFALDAGERTLSLSYLGKIGRDEHLLRLIDAKASQDDKLLREALGLTAREAEVLVWIARGKSNRDIGEILGISSRTVDKHLEQLYAKLGVDNRASAAALAARVLGQRA